MDRDVVSAAQGGDREAFAILARSLGGRLHAIARRMLRDDASAEDAVQQALIAAWRELPSLRDPERFTAWVSRVLVHECLAASRRRCRVASPLHVPWADLPSARDDVHAIIDRDQLERGFRRLPEDQRALLVLRHYLGMEPAEIAMNLGVAAGTVRSRLHYAHQAMRAALEADERAAALTHASVVGARQDVTVSSRP